MSVYVLSDVEFLDEELADTYRSVAQSSIALYGGRYIVRGAEPEVLEGDVPEGQRLVMIEFPDAETARRWYGSIQPSLRGSGGDQGVGTGWWHTASRLMPYGSVTNAP